VEIVQRKLRFSYKESFDLKKLILAGNGQAPAILAQL
jgi:hypothetical protein